MTSVKNYTPSHHTRLTKDKNRIFCHLTFRTEYFPLAQDAGKLLHTVLMAQMTTFSMICDLNQCIKTKILTCMKQTHGHIYQK